MVLNYIECGGMNSAELTCDWGQLRVRLFVPFEITRNRHRCSYIPGCYRVISMYALKNNKSSYLIVLELFQCKYERTRNRHSCCYVLEQRWPTGGPRLDLLRPPPSLRFIFSKS
jgi:hypothetical protein